MGSRIVRRNRAKNRIKVVLLILMLLVGILLTTYIVTALGEDREQTEEFTGMQKHIRKYAHISIDDATQIFQDISFHSYDSIFDNQTMMSLQKLHEKYGLKVTLYVFGELDTFDLDSFPDFYKTEFQQNADWLKIGFHSITEQSPEETGLGTEEFLEGFEKVNREICRFAGQDSLAHVLRLHYWYATDPMVEELKERGVEGLLCGRATNECYNLKEKQIKNLLLSRDGKLHTEISYYVTDIRLEKTDDVTGELKKSRNDRIMVIFTHAWCFAENQDKLEEALKWLTNAGYEFTFLEGMDD